MTDKENDFDQAHAHEGVYCVVNALVSVHLTPVSRDRNKYRDHKGREDS